MKQAFLKNSSKTEKRRRNERKGWKGEKGDKDFMNKVTFTFKKKPQLKLSIFIVKNMESHWFLIM